MSAAWDQVWAMLTELLGRPSVQAGYVVSAAVLVVAALVLARRARWTAGRSAVAAAAGLTVALFPALTLARRGVDLRRDPWAQLCVMNNGFFGDWLYVEGEAEVVSLPEAMEPLVEYYRGISGETDWDEYRAGMERENRVIIRVTPKRAGPDRTG